MKIAVIGGGSTYTPELADGLGRLTGARVTELVLVDPDESRLAAVGPVSARIMRAHGHPAGSDGPTDLDDGLDGAAAVLIQLRVGGQAARTATRPGRWTRLRGAGDHRGGRPGQGAADGAAGPGHRRAGPPAGRPGAWIIDFTNPVGIVTRALLDAGHRAVGLCNVAIGLQRYFAGCSGSTRRGSRWTTSD